MAEFCMPLGLAFNLGTILPVIALPVSVWVCLKLYGVRFPAAVLAAVFSLAVLLNEGYSMSGGNGLSTLAGQFAHMYAVNFILLAMGVLAWETKKRLLPWRSGMLLAMVAISHGYLYFGAPLLLAVFVIVFPGQTFLFRLTRAGLAGVFSLLFALWFIGPMVLNNIWTTPHTFQWTFQDWQAEVIPKIFEPAIFLLIFGMIFLTWTKPKKEEWTEFLNGFFWVGSAFAYVGLFFIFRALKLVDVRAIPQIQLFLMIATGVIVAGLVRSLARWQQISFALILVCAMSWWTHSKVERFSKWLTWNYSGWESKSNWPQFKLLADFLQGSLSEPRVAYEHNVSKNGQSGRYRASF
jgi:hypothetical protein